MNLWNENRLIDIMGHVDPVLLEEEFPEYDLEKETALSPVTEQKQRKKRIVLVASMTAGSLALTGVAFLVGRKHEWMRHVVRRKVHAA